MRCYAEITGRTGLCQQIEDPVNAFVMEWRDTSFLSLIAAKMQNYPQLLWFYLLYFFPA
jgi:hypothetical protein